MKRLQRVGVESKALVELGEGQVDVVPRQFLRDFVNVLDKTREYPEYNPDAEYEFDRATAPELSPVEQEAIEPITF